MYQCYSILTIYRPTGTLHTNKKYTDWDKFRYEIDRQINVSVKMKTAENPEILCACFIESIGQTAKHQLRCKKIILCGRQMLPIASAKKAKHI